MDKFKRKIHARVPVITVPGLSASPFFGVFPQEDSFGVALEGEEEADDDGDGVLRCIIIRRCVEQQARKWTADLPLNDSLDGGRRKRRLRPVLGPRDDGGAKWHTWSIGAGAKRLFWGFFCGPASRESYYCCTVSVVDRNSWIWPGDLRFWEGRCGKVRNL